MKKGLKIALISIVGFFAVLILALQIVLNSKLVTNAVDKFAAENIDGKLAYSDIKISLLKRFPQISVYVGNLSITYPHGRFASYDNSSAASSDLYYAGRAAAVDTLAGLESLDLTVDAWQLLAGRIRVSDLDIDKLSAYAHSYDSKAANWMIFKSSSEPKDSTKKTSLPWISLGRLSISSPKLVYTNSQNDVSARLDFTNLQAKANVKISDNIINIHSASLRLDSLGLKGCLKTDSLDFALDYLRVEEPRINQFGITCTALANANTYSFGRLTIPLDLEGRVNFDQNDERVRLDVPNMALNIAFIPFLFDGDISLFPGHIDLDATAKVDGCPVDSLLHYYSERILSSAKKIDTDAILSLDLSARGSYSKDKLPELTARLLIPASKTHYEPIDIDAGLALDLSAELSENMYLKAVVRELRVSSSGVDINLHGSGDDILGSNPYYSLGLKSALQLRPLLRLMPASLGVKSASGDLNLDLEAGLHQSDIKALKFREANLSGAIHSNNLYLDMPADSLEAKAFKTAIIASSSPSGLKIDADMDSVYVKIGEGMIARVREISNKGVLSKVLTPAGEYVPRLDVSTDSKEIFLQSGSSKFGVRGTSIALSALKRSSSALRRRRALMDSTSIVRRRDSLERRLSPQSDIYVSLDSSLMKYVREWEPSGYVKLDEGFYASPAMPLRTRLNSLRARIDNETINLDSLFIESGSSDLSATIAVHEWRKALRRRSSIKSEMSIDFGRLNINEIVAALQVGQKDTAIVSVSEEKDESFVTDTLENADLQVKGLPLILLPANIDAELYLNAGIINYSEMEIGPASVDIKLKDKTLQLANTNISTEIGKILIDAFYSTRTRNDIKTGVDLRLRDMSAYDIIHLLPTVDSMLPALKSFSGNLNCDFTATAQIDTNMNVIIPSIDGLARFNGDNLEVQDAGKLKNITKLLLFRNKDIGAIDNLTVNAMVHDSKIEVFPFQFGVDRYVFAMQGMQGFDKSMYYHLSMLRSPFIFRFGINLFGYLDNWHFSLGRAKFSDGKLPAYTQQIDTVQLNIAKSIRNIFDKSINEVVRYNDSQLHDLQIAGNLQSPDGVTSDLLSLDDYQMIGDVFLQQELMEQDRELLEEVNATIEDSYADTAKLMKDYESSLYSKGMLRKLERLRKQREREEAKKNKS